MICCKVVTKIFCYTVARRPIVDCELGRMGSKQKLQHHKLLLSLAFFYLRSLCCRESAFVFMSENENVVDMKRKKWKTKINKDWKSKFSWSLFYKKNFSSCFPHFGSRAEVFSNKPSTGGRSRNFVKICCDFVCGAICQFVLWFLDLFSWMLRSEALKESLITHADRLTCGEEIYILWNMHNCPTDLTPFLRLFRKGNLFLKQKRNSKSISTCFRWGKSIFSITRRKKLESGTKISPILMKSIAN